MPEECVTELKATSQGTVTVCVLFVAEKGGMPQIVAVGSYHSLHRLPRVTAWVVNFTRILKHLPQLDIMELMSQVKILWIQEAQDTLVIDRNFESEKTIRNISGL